MFSYPMLPCIGLLVLLLCVMELVLDVKLSIFGQCMLVLLLLELLLVGSGLLAVTGAVVCMDCVSMLVCLVSYGSSGIVSRYLVMQSDLSVFLWLCILTQYSFGLPSDVDYVHYGKYDVWLPVVNTVSITLIVQHTPDQLVQFNWDKFASGDLVKGGFT